MLASGYNNSTTTYAYDPSGARVLQTSTTSTTYYPNEYYSFTSTKIGANTYATSTNYVWNGDTLLATVDQPLYNGSATGSPITRFIRPDHLGSTNAVTDQNGSLVQLMDYYPYGATRIATSTYPTNEKRQYIGQFSDAQTNLNYLMSRYYDGQRGQFVSQDPVFWEDPKGQDLRNPQSLNSYSYANDNPITGKDTDGRQVTAPVPAINPYVALAILILTVVAQALSSMQTHSFSAAPSFPSATPSSVVQPLPSSNPYSSGPLIPQPSSFSGPKSGFQITPLNPGSLMPWSSINFSDPKPPKNFIPPTNPPQMPPSPDSLPPGDTIRIGPKTPQYPDGYWKQTNSEGQPIDPSTGKPPSDAKTTPDVRSRTHVPLPPGTNLPPGPYTP
jgi:RHS repeat-associated protein